MCVCMYVCIMHICVCVCMYVCKVFDRGRGAISRDNLRGGEWCHVSLSQTLARERCVCVCVCVYAFVWPHGWREALHYLVCVCFLVTNELVLVCLLAF